MSYTQLIKDTLNILDLTIYFEENCLTKERYKGQICLIYKGTLQYTPEECPHCLNPTIALFRKLFSRLSLSTRKAVEFIVIDRYAPYVSLVKKLFPNAQLIIDRFHIVQHIGRTFLNH